MIQQESHCSQWFCVVPNVNTSTPDENRKLPVSTQMKYIVHCKDYTFDFRTGLVITLVDVISQNEIHSKGLEDMIHVHFQQVMYIGKAKTPTYFMDYP